MAARPVRVLVADDEPVIRSALRELIAAHPALEFVGAAADAQEAIDQAAELHPDVVLLDVRMPHGGGPRAAAEIDALPDAPSTVAFSAYDDRSAIVSMLDAGACGYLVKGAANADIVGTLLDASRAGPRAPTRSATQAPAGLGAETAGARAPGPTSPGVARILIADDPGAARQALELVIDGADGFELAAVAGNAAEALRLSCIHRPHAVLIGRELPGDSTLAIQEIRQAVPETSIVAYTAEAEPRGVREAVEAGAMSYVVHGDRDEEILEALREAGRGRSLLSPPAATAVVGELRVSPARARERRRRLRRRAQLERFIRGDGLGVVLQPIFDLASGRPVAVEALARFNGGARGGPSVWFAEAAAEGLGVALELAAVRQALAVLGRLPEALSLSVNISPAVAASPQLRQQLGDAPVARLIIELTEHAAVDDYGALARALGDLRAAGLRVAVDDAGAGFASLRHVLQIEPDLLKLDISLCSGIAGDRRRRALARALLAFAAETGIGTVAEGVERSEDLAALRELGVQLGQGFHLGAPAPAEALSAE